MSWSCGKDDNENLAKRAGAQKVDQKSDDRDDKKIRKTKCNLKLV